MAEILPLILGHFLVGFAGGFGHCILMCHPFVLHISSIFSSGNSGYRILIPNSFNFLAKLKIMNKIKKYKPNNPFFYGLLLGFLPCGLTMGAIIGAAPSGLWYTGALMMAAFGIGTSIALMILAVLGSYIMQYVKYFKHLTAILLLIMGIYFIYQGIIFTY